jgi:SagB-type dehydrogenase family enzyme
MPPPSDPIRLPPPRFSGPVSLEQALLARRSIRHIARDPLTVDELTQLLWASQGVTRAQGFRTAPSAGALFPLELHVAAGCVTGLRTGLYRYRPLEHALVASVPQDLRADLCRAALSQRPVERAPVVFLLTAVYGRSTAKYGERGVRYADLEAGHAAQNLILQAAALELKAVVVGAFSDDVRRIALLPPEEEPLYLVPVGR